MLRFCWAVLLVICAYVACGVHAEFDSGFAMDFEGFAFLGKFCFVRLVQT
jgi:hypothetical protein